MSDLLRVYFDPAEIGQDGYPLRWHKSGWELGGTGDHAIKNFVRELAGNRCVRCGHPYEKGAGEWSVCDQQCTHAGPVRWRSAPDRPWYEYDGPSPSTAYYATRGTKSTSELQAQWRILTVHHLNRVKHDCRWWNLVALCQRCHLTIQGKVYLERRWRQEHSDWFKPYAAGWYAWSFLGEELSREETMARLDELLALEDRQLDLSLSSPPVKETGRG